MVGDQQQPGQRCVAEQGDARARREHGHVRVEQVEAGRDHVHDSARPPDQHVEQLAASPTPRTRTAAPSQMRSHHPGAEPDGVQRPRRRSPSATGSRCTGRVDLPQVGGRASTPRRPDAETGRVDVQVDLGVRRRPSGLLPEGERERQRDEAEGHRAARVDLAARARRHRARGPGARPAPAAVRWWSVTAVKRSSRCLRHRRGQLYLAQAPGAPGSGSRGGRRSRGRSSRRHCPARPAQQLARDDRPGAGCPPRVCACERSSRSMSRSGLSVPAVVSRLMILAVVAVGVPRTGRSGLGPVWSWVCTTPRANHAHAATARPSTAKRRANIARLSRSGPLTRAARLFGTVRLSAIDEAAGGRPQPKPLPPGGDSAPAR